MEKIYTLGNKCYSAPIVQMPKQSRPKRERISLKHGKIRVSITNTKKVRCYQEGTALVIILEE